MLSDGSEKPEQNSVNREFKSLAMWSGKAGGSLGRCSSIAMRAVSVAHSLKWTIDLESIETWEKRQDYSSISTSFSFICIIKI